MGNAKYVRPLCFGASGSVRASNMPRSATCAPEVHTFWPVMIHSSPSRTARVCTLARSEPAPGSLKSWHQPCLAVDDRPEVGRLLLVAAVRQDRRAGQQQPEARRRTGRTRLA